MIANGPIGNCVLMRIRDAISEAIVTPPIQNALKFPAVRPLSTLSDAPPSRDAVTTSRTWRE
jgi:hypothetical protein